MPARSIDPDDYQDVPRPVGAMAKDFAAGHVIAAHSHRRAQLVYASSGVMRVRTADGVWVVPPQRALWVPAGTVHEVEMAGPVAMRTLYLARAAARRLPRTCCVVAVTPLLRELILRAVELPLLYDEAGAPGRIMALILDEIRALPVLPLALPAARERRVQRICRHLLADPADARTLEEWGRTVGASARTLARLFVSDTGLTFGGWRQQARLMEALTRLAQGQAVTTVALDLGYESPSAFTSMFRRALGRTPSAYFEAGDPPPRRTAARLHRPARAG